MSPIGDTAISKDSPMQRKDIHPKTPIRTLNRNLSDEVLVIEFDVTLVSALLGMKAEFAKRALDKRGNKFTLKDVFTLLDQDAFGETFVPRSLIPEYLLKTSQTTKKINSIPVNNFQARHLLFQGDSLDLIKSLPDKIINCIVTSTPYWGMRLYPFYLETEWADGEICSLGHEQTPEGFIRHTLEILYHLKRVMVQDGSIWWNLMDTYNTRTQIRTNASETLRAMKGEDPRGWRDYECRRYSAGHSFLLDGEQCLIPSRVAERASRIGYYVKSMIYWKKEGSMPETVNSRVTREAETIMHLSLQRTPYFDKEAYRILPQQLGGRNTKFEFDKVTDVWTLPTASGTDGHGAQFPLSLPGRCIGISTKQNDLILDPFVGSGTTSLAAAKLERRSIGFDVNSDFLQIAQKRLASNGFSLESNLVSQ